MLLILSAHAIGAERQIGVEPGDRQVGRYQRIEFTVRVDTVGDDPHDPDEIDLRMEVTSPSGKVAWTPAFRYQPYERRPLSRGGNSSEWLYPTGQMEWRVRYAPIEVGRHTCSITLKDRAGVARSKPFTFECTPANSRGFIRVSTKDPRYMEFDDGTPFFAVGQNVAFVINSYRTSEMIRKLGENGANFARVWACAEDWAMGIEARKSAWGRSWSWNPPFVAMPDRDGYHAGQLCLKVSGEAGASLTAQPTHPVALRPNTRYQFTGRTRGDELTVTLDRGTTWTVPAQKQWTAFKEEFTTGADQWWLAGPTLRLPAKGTTWLRDLSLKEAAGGAGGPELLWEADPNRPILGAYNQADCFMLDQIVEAAEQSGVHLQLALFTRDHYMSMLAKENSRQYDQAIASGRKLVRYCSARWGYSTHIAAWEYFNEMNPGLPTNRFYSELGETLEQVDVNRHPRANSTWSSPSKDYKHPKLDTADLHYYIRPSTKELWKDEVASVLAQWERIRQHAAGRPILFSEFGITDDRWQRARELDNDKDFVHLHNALWASALCGFSSTVCHWYWDDIHKRNLYHHYQAIGRFTAQIPWTTGRLRPVSATCDKDLRVIGQAGDQGAYLWISDPRATWWSIAMDNAAARKIEDASLTVSDLPAGRYHVEWWDTREGTVTLRQESRAVEGRLTASVPAFSGDVACRIIRADP